MGTKGRVLAGTLAAWMVWAPLATDAAVSDGMQHFFNSFDNAVVTGTPAGAYQSQSRGYLTGGSLAVRVPMQTTQLLSLTPPSFNMGCNGFDGHFGALSHVSLDRFIQLLTQLGTGATLGFAYQLAMNYLSPSIHTVVSQIESIVRFVNQTANVSPCQLGKQLGEELAHSINGHSGQPMIGQRLDTLRGVIRDPMEHMEQLGLQNPATLAAKLRGQTVGSDNWDLRGNIVWDVLDRYFSAIDYDSRRLLMSAVGTIVVDDNGEAVYYPSLVTAQDLIEVQPGQSVTVYACEDPSNGCLSLTHSTVTDMQGFEPMIRQRLEQAVAAFNSAGALSDEVKRWLDQLAHPVYSVLAAQRDPAQRLDYIGGTSRLFAARLTREFLSQLTRGLEHGISQYKKWKPNWPGNVKQIYDRIWMINQYLLDLEIKIAQREADTRQLTNEVLNQSALRGRLR